jgi:hypothetical protein
MPPSEVACHLGVAGQALDFELTPGPHPMVQLLRPDGSHLSFPITCGEAGVFGSATGQRYYYPTTAEAAPGSL